MRCSFLTPFTSSLSIAPLMNWLNLMACSTISSADGNWGMSLSLSSVTFLVISSALMPASYCWVSRSLDTLSKCERSSNGFIVNLLCVLCESAGFYAGVRQPVTLFTVKNDSPKGHVQPSLNQVGDIGASHDVSYI